jgi:uncharacterized protein (DUF58 family)
MYAAIRNRIDTWLFQLRGPETGAVVLVQRRVFILPTRQGLVFAAVLVIMLTGSINYTLGLGFVLTFLLVAMGVHAMIHTFRNLANLRVTGGRAHPVFAGDTAIFTIHLENGSDSDRYAIGLAQGRKEAAFFDVPANTTVPASVGIPAAQRGRLRPGRLTLFTRFPIGLYRAWSYVEFDMHCLVYPRPAFPGLPLPPATASAGASAGARHSLGQEDFAGLRQYHVGDSPRHIAWKAAARDERLLTKQFSGRAESELWLDWSQLPSSMGMEGRLSHLARWVVEAHTAGLSYGLRLPGKTVDLGFGEAQREHCLEALALYGNEQ